MWMHSLALRLGDARHEPIMCKTWHLFASPKLRYLNVHLFWPQLVKSLAKVFFWYLNDLETYSNSDNSTSMTSFTWQRRSIAKQRVWPSEVAKVLAGDIVRPLVPGLGEARFGFSLDTPLSTGTGTFFGAGIWWWPARSRRQTCSCWSTGQPLVFMETLQLCVSQMVKFTTHVSWIQLNSVESQNLELNSPLWFLWCVKQKPRVPKTPPALQLGLRGWGEA